AFEALLRHRPGDVPALIQLGLAEKAQGAIEAAGDCFRRAAELDPQSAVARFYLGESLYNRGLNDLALEALEASIARNPDYAEAHYLLAFVCGDLGLHDRARDATKRAIALNPTLARAQANLSLDRLWNAEERPRPQRVEAAVGAPVEGALAHFQLGLAFRQKGYFAEALREYRLALEAGEPPALVREAMAEVHLLKRDHVAAFEIYDELVREKADSPKLWNERGICLHQAGRREEAAASYERAVATDRAYAMAWNNLGVLRNGTNGGDPQAAFRTALERQPSLQVARLNLALVLVQRRQLPAALDTYRQVLSVDPRNAVAWNGVGLVLMELKRWPDARNAFGRAVEADPTLAAAHYHLGFALGQLGEFDGALRATKRALELESYYVAQKFLLATDLQYEEPAITIVPEVATTVGAEQLGGEFAFDAAVLDRLFDELTPVLPAAEPVRPADDPFSLSRDYLSKGLLELATAELTRAAARGQPRARAHPPWRHLRATRAARRGTRALSLRARHAGR
ncbi:MAG TPA: tetratricopeptide repeat protein, partial [Planctomycetota bacterium]|nr:tetratricopeptide repeat protein [Planctomycetota bacterium]